MPIRLEELRVGDRVIVGANKYNHYKGIVVWISENKTTCHICTENNDDTWKNVTPEEMIRKRYHDWVNLPSSLDKKYWGGNSEVDYMEYDVKITYKTLSTFVFRSNKGETNGI